MALVLIVVDEPDVMLLLRRDLESRGHRSVLAADAERALEWLAFLAIDAVIVDVMMPVRDGWIVLEALRDRAHWPSAILVTGRAATADLDRAARLGIAASLPVPYSQGELDRALALGLPAERLGSAAPAGRAVEAANP